MKLLACLEEFIVALRTTRSDYPFFSIVVVIRNCVVEVAEGLEMSKREHYAYTQIKSRESHLLVVSS